MNCADLRNAFLRGTAPERARASEHLDACAACRALLGAGNRLGTALAAAAGGDTHPPTASPDFPPALDQALDADRAWRGRLRALPARARFGIVLAAGMLPVAVGIARRPATLHAASLAELLLLGASFAVVSSTVLAPLSRPERPARRWTLALLAALVPFALALRAPAGVLNEGAGAAALACFAFGSSLVVPLLLLLHLLERRPRPSLTGAVLAAVASGLASGALLEVHCAIEHAAHLALGHASIGALWALAYGLHTRAAAPATR